MMALSTAWRLPVLWLGASALSLVLGSCGGEAPSEPPGQDPQESVASSKEEAREPFVIEAPRPRLRIPQEIELLNESLTNAFQLLAQKVFIRDWHGISEFLHPEFQGHDPFGLPLEHPEPLALGAKVYHGDIERAEVVDRAGWMASLEKRVGAWRRLEESLWKVRGGEFLRSERPSWGRIEWAAHLVGVTTDGTRELIEMSGYARVDRVEGQGWALTQLQLDEQVTVRDGFALFKDVTRASGVHHEGLRYGRPGNDSDGWNGIAGHDVNGDGYWDVFLPSPQRSFLYLGQKEGGFVEVAEASGLGAEAGGTAALFLDLENDGDPDLVVGHIGWRDLRKRGGGQTLKVYENDGKGVFQDVTEAWGLGELRLAAFGLSALDYDGDGYLDLYVSAYGRMGYRRNDSWNEATNGEPDRLLRNLQGGGFEDVTEAAGITERGWSYTPIAADFDEDGDPDLYVTTTFGSNHYWENQGDGTFRNRAKELGIALRGNSMGVSVGDPNEDGNLDLFLTNPSSNTGRRILKRFEEDKRRGVWKDLARMAGGNLLLQGDGAGGFEVIEKAGGAGSSGWAWGQALADFDLDGHQDIYCVNGFVTGDIPQDT